MKTNTSPPLIHDNTSPLERGISLVELLVYMAIMSILIAAVVLTANTLFTTFIHMRTNEAVAQAGHLALERMTREIRAAESVDVSLSTFDSSPGTLRLNILDGGTPSTITFTATTSRIMIIEGTADAEPLTHTDVTISNLLFHYVDGTETEGVRISFTAEKSAHGATTTKAYRTFVVLDNQ